LGVPGLLICFRKYSLVVALFDDMLNVGGPGEGWVNVYTKQLVCSNSLSSLQHNIRQGQVNVSAKLMHYVSVAKPFFFQFLERL